MHLPKHRFSLITVTDPIVGFSQAADGTDVLRAGPWYVAIDEDANGFDDPECFTSISNLIRSQRDEQACKNLFLDLFTQSHSTMLSSTRRPQPNVDDPATCIQLRERRPPT